MWLLEGARHEIRSDKHCSIGAGDGNRTRVSSLGRWMN